MNQARYSRPGALFCRRRTQIKRPTERSYPASQGLSTANRPALRSAFDEMMALVRWGDGMKQVEIMAAFRNDVAAVIQHD